jgi:hypothetical protein
MGIEMWKGSRGRGPVVVCDQCGERIKDASDGNYQWTEEDPGRGYFTHKRCCRAFEREREDRGFWLACDLSAFWVYLGDNLQIDKGKARRVADLLASI